MTRPLAIDLYCGLDLSEAEFLSRVYAAIKQLVTGRAQNPNHMPLSVGGEPPSPVASKLGFMRYLEDARFPACLAGIGHFWITALQPIQCRVFETASGLILCSTLWVLAPRPYPAQLTRSLDCTVRRAIPTVAIRWRDLEMRPTAKAIAPLLRRSIVLFSANPTGACRAIRRAPFFVWTNCLERRAALSAR